MFSSVFLTLLLTSMQLRVSAPLAILSVGDHGVLKGVVAGCLV